MTSGQGAREQERKRKREMFLLSLKDLVSIKSDLGEIRFQSVYDWNRCAITKCSARVAELGVLAQGDGINFCKA